MSERDEMRLPPGKTCSDCGNFTRCSMLLGGRIATWTSCDWYPSRFVEAVETAEIAALRATVEREARADERDRVLTAIEDWLADVGQPPFSIHELLAKLRSAP